MSQLVDQTVGSRAPNAAAPSRPTYELPEHLRCPIEADGVRRMIPQTWPFIYLDRVIELDPGVRAVGIKSVSQTEPHFAGHFPHASVMPGVLIIESLAQLGGLLVTALAEVAPDDPRVSQVAGRGFLAAVNRFRFREVVRPGDQLRLMAERSGGSGPLWELRCEARVGPTVVAEGRLVLAT